MPRFREVPGGFFGKHDGCRIRQKWVPVRREPRAVGSPPAKVGLVVRDGLRLVMSRMGESVVYQEATSEGHDLGLPPEQSMEVHRRMIELLEGCLTAHALNLGLTGGAESTTTGDEWKIAKTG